jgi:DNA-directed RNA polymerase subunit RPC12/RpoP
LCMNFIERGFCHVTGEKCFLGLRGATAKNVDGECELHGRFDVWLTQRNDLLITDMGFPAEEPKQCFALGINEHLARSIASERAKQMKTSVLTTQRRCIKCGTQYWMTQYRDSLGLLETGRANFCPNCRASEIDEEMERRLGAQRYWCG